LQRKTIPKTGRRDTLGEFEHLVLAAVKTLGTDAYGAKISETLLNVVGPGLAVAQVYVVLQRLQDKGFVTSRFSQPEARRGGRAKRVFSLEGRGVEALKLGAATRSAASRFILGAKDDEKRRAPKHALGSA
jgi:PadR family transcriptional regulator PadR